MSDQKEKIKVSRSSVKIKVGIGFIVAAILSYVKGNGLVWIIIHSLFGWLYVGYVCLGCSGG